MEVHSSSKGDRKAGTPKDRIRTVKFVYLVANSSTNGIVKSEYCDFERIDCDSSIPNPDDASWKSRLKDHVNRALEAAFYSDNVMISQTDETPNQRCQDFFVQKLIEAGALEENITVVRLATDGDVSASYRTKFCNWRPKIGTADASKQ